jgi:hypothetical protein
MAPSSSGVELSNEVKVIVELESNLTLVRFPAQLVQ